MDTGYPAAAQFADRRTGGGAQLGRRDDIWPTETDPVVRRLNNGTELAQMRWSFEPSNPKSPRRHYLQIGGMLLREEAPLPCDCLALPEFTGTEPSKFKLKFKFILTVEDWFCFGRLWSFGSAERCQTSAPQTTTTGPDDAPTLNLQWPSCALKIGSHGSTLAKRRPHCGPRYRQAGLGVAGSPTCAISPRRPTSSSTDVHSVSR